MTSRSPLIVLAAALLFGACASTPPPVDSIARAEQAIRKADEAQASRYAPLELVKAREKLDVAREAARDDDEWARARHMADQAVVDAQLAEEKARAKRAEKAADEMQSTIDSLRTEAGLEK